MSGPDLFRAMGETASRGGNPCGGAPISKATAHNESPEGARATGRGAKGEENGRPGRLNAKSFSQSVDPTNLEKSGVGFVGDNHCLTNRKSSSSLGKFMKPEHKRMSRMLGYCLTLGTADAWSGFKVACASRLTATERAALGFASLKSLDPRQAELTARAAIGAAGSPTPAFLGGMADARHWAAYASPLELKAHACAAFEVMSPKDQAAFFRHISEMELAA